MIRLLLLAGLLLLRVPYVPSKWNNFLHLKPYRRGNSWQGIRLASIGTNAIDLDWHRSKDGIFVNTHWRWLFRERFKYTEASVAAGIPRSKVGKVCRRRVDALPWAVLETLKTDDGYVLQNAGTALGRAAARRVRVECELKFTPTSKQLDRLARAAQAAYGGDWRDWVQVKRLTNLRGWRLTIERAKAAGFVTFAINVRNPAALDRLPARQRPDYYRGKPR